jgi:hypothetical protein
MDKDEALRKALEALEKLFKCDQRNTCQHEETYRSGAIWEICEGCSMKWADDRGGKPKWKNPPEWDLAHTAIAAINQALAAQPAPTVQEPMTDEYIHAACGEIFASDHPEPGAYDVAVWRAAEKAYGITKEQA